MPFSIQIVGKNQGQPHLFLPTQCHLGFEWQNAGAAKFSETSCHRPRGPWQASRDLADPGGVTPKTSSPSRTKRQRLGGACDFPPNRAGTCSVFGALLSFLELWDSARGARWGGRQAHTWGSRASPGQRPFSSFLRAWGLPHPPG